MPLTTRLGLLLALLPSLAAAQPVATVQQAGSAEVGVARQPVTFRFSCALRGGRPNLLSVEMVLSQSDRIAHFFDVGRFEGPTGIGGNLRMIADNDTTRSQFDRSVTGSRVMSGVNLTFAFSTSATPDEESFYRPMATLVSLLGTTSSRLVWQLDNPDPSGPPIVATARLSDADAARIKAATSRCTANATQARGTSAASASGANVRTAASRSGQPTMRPGALDDVPQNLAEIGWETDLPYLLVIRYFPQRMSFSAGWSGWVLAYWFHLTRSMRWPQPDPWPPFFITAGASPAASSALVLNWPEAQKEQFQEWCIKRSRAIPKVIVQTVPLIRGGSDGGGLTLRPFGLGPGTPIGDQRVLGVGFSMTIALGLDRDVEAASVTVPEELVARWPKSGLNLETRVGWDEPVREDGSLFIPGQPRSLRVTKGETIIWEHTYSGI